MKKSAARLPKPWQQELKRWHFSRQIRRGTFRTEELEYAMLDTWLAPGDWALDVGANVGQYTKRLSDLVGASGRVLAFEPMATTFALLSANVAHFEHANVTLLNAAASEDTRIVSMALPKFDCGLDNYYEAHISDSPGGASVMTLPIDSLHLPQRVSLVKIDAEGHEPGVLRGMSELIARDRPVIVLEVSSDDPKRFLAARGYVCRQLDGSWNQIFTPAASRGD